MSIHTTAEIDPVNPLAPQVYQLLRQAIVTGALAPGERLSDIELAKSMDISRQPIREAFMRLQTDDLLDVRPQRGTFVKLISVPAVLDARFVREAIEADIVRLLARQSDAALITSLRSLLTAQRKVAKQPPEQFMRLDDEFHRMLAEGAGKANAWRVIEEVKTQMDRVRYLSFNHFHVERLIRQHANIVKAIESQSAELAVTGMRQHLRGILDSIHLISAEMPEFFTQANAVFPGLPIDKQQESR